MYEFEILKKVDNAKWNNHLLESEYSTFFQTAEFLTEDTSNKYPIFIYVYDENGELKRQVPNASSQRDDGFGTNLATNKNDIL